MHLRNQIQTQVACYLEWWNFFLVSLQIIVGPSWITISKTSFSILSCNTGAYSANVMLKQNTLA